jgi:hypothetical protein
MLACATACASAPPPSAPAPAVDPVDEHEAPPEEPAPATTVTGLDAAERSAPPSTKSYDEALSTPERLDVNDDRVHLTDAQLTGPIRGVLTGCRVPSNARVTVKTAVQAGRAIGVTVIVRFEHPPPPKRPSRAAQRAAALTAKAEAKVSAKVVTCVDRAVRAVVWPPSSRRDSFATDF